MGQNLTEQAFQRLAIAKSLVRNSIDSLMESSDPSDETFTVLQDLTVALYELEQLTQDFGTLLRS